MYIQITERCNMRCRHCCMKATHRGRDMTFDVFKKALEYDDIIAIGGGEPTVHPEFEKFLLYAIANVDDVWLATNGKITDIALALAALAKKGVIGCALSMDDYHGRIDGKVVHAFVDDKPSDNDYRFRDRATGEMDLREIRDVTGKVSAVGRDADWEDATDDCACPGPFVKPDGKVYQCGCPDSFQIGDVFDGFMMEGAEECYKEVEKTLAEMRKEELPV